MSGLGLEITPGVCGIGLSIPDSHANDPITKAVYNNLMGNIPKKTKTPSFCDVCKQEFSSQIVLDMHLAGSKHQRKISSIQLMKSLEETESGFEKDEMTGVITCKICSVTVNSPQLLATHVAGNKHQIKKKGKRVNGNSEDGAPIKKHCTEDLSMRNSSNNGLAIINTKQTNAENEELAKKNFPKKKERPLLNITIPTYVTKLEENKTGGKFLCNPCGAHCNSDVQLQQHLDSKKHLDKVSVKKNDAFSHNVGSGNKGWNQRGAFKGRGNRGMKGNKRGGRVSRFGGKKVGSDGYKKYGENDSGAWENITEVTSSNVWTSDSGRGSRGGRGDRGARKGTATKWLSNLPSLIPNSNTSTSFSQKNSYDQSLLGTNFNDGLGATSLFSSPSDYGFTRGSGANRSLRGNRARAAQVPSYFMKPEDVMTGRDTTFRRAETSFGNVSAEYPSRITSEYDMQDTEGYNNQVSEFVPRKFDYHHNQSSNVRGYDYNNGYGDTNHTAPLEYENNYGGGAYSLSHNTRTHGAISYAYTQPLSQNFVAGGSIM